MFDLMSNERMISFLEKVCVAELDYLLHYVHDNQISRWDYNIMRSPRVSRLCFDLSPVAASYVVKLAHGNKIFVETLSGICDPLGRRRRFSPDVVKYLLANSSMFELVAVAPFLGSEGVQVWHDAANGDDELIKKWVRNVPKKNVEIQFATAFFTYAQNKPQILAEVPYEWYQDTQMLLISASFWETKLRETKTPLVIDDVDVFLIFKMLAHLPKRDAVRLHRLIFQNSVFTTPLYNVLVDIIMVIAHDFTNHDLQQLAGRFRSTDNDVLNHYVLSMLDGTAQLEGLKLALVDEFLRNSPRLWSYLPASKIKKLMLSIVSVDPDWVLRRMLDVAYWFDSEKPVEEILQQVVDAGAMLDPHMFTSQRPPPFALVFAETFHACTNSLVWRILTERFYDVQHIERWLNVIPLHVLNDGLGKDLADPLFKKLAGLMLRLQSELGSPAVKLAEELTKNFTSNINNLEKVVRTSFVS